MSAACYLGQARALAEPCIARERARLGGNTDEARTRLARRIGWAPGTLYNLMRDRLKRLDRDLRDQLAAYAIQDLENEIAALNSELASARRLGDAENSTLVRKVEAVLADAQSLHDRLVGGAA